MPTKTWNVRISGSGVVSTTQAGPPSGSGVTNELPHGQRISIPHGDYTMTELPNGDYRLIGASGRAYILAGADIHQYLRNETLKVPSDWP
jgi:hypothetical protein